MEKIGMSAHFIKKCSCGKVIKECACPSATGTKRVIMIQKGCPSCQAEAHDHR